MCVCAGWLAGWDLARTKSAQIGSQNLLQSMLRPFDCVKNTTRCVCQMWGLMCARFEPRNDLARTKSAQIGSQNLLKSMLRPFDCVKKTPPDVCARCGV